MDARFQIPNQGIRCAAVLAILIGAMSLGGCNSGSPGYANQTAFDDPSSAVTALGAAMRSNDTRQMEAIFGPESEEILSSGDPVEDQMQREVFLVAFDQGWSLQDRNESTRELIIGDEQWPFPIPLVHDDHGWWFDTAAGMWEILARRIGRNELAAIGALRIYANAQGQYASTGHDGRPAGIFAQQVRSSPGRHDGLYWAQANPADPPSPLGELAAQATAEGYGKQAHEGLSPFHGYFFRILKGQGGNAPGGARNYVVNGDMTGGFAMIAYPAEYRNSGIMTFLVGPDGIVYQSDLGEDTFELASGIMEYDPDDTWIVAE